jgi:membrane peptidoglycan carboxypeptidase
MTKPVNRWSKVSIGAISMGQEIGISPLQLIGLISTIANDGVWVAPRIVAGTVAPQSRPQTISFQPAESRRVISSLTAAQMRQMLEGVVLHGTGRKALLEGYTSAGKTGTGQEVDPRTRTYSKTRYNASFAGFAPINDPKVSVAVILDSPVGLHQGGQVSAPVFQRITQQVLEYMHVPHDVEISPKRQLLLAQMRKASEKDFDEDSPDHLGTGLDVADAGEAQPSPAASKPVTIANQVVPAAITKKVAGPSLSTTSTAANTNLQPKPDSTATAKPPTNGTVMLDVEEGGIEVPSFLGKNVRSAIEQAQDAGLDLDAVGSGVAKDQSPAAGSKVAAGARVIVRFGR